MIAGALIARLAPYLIGATVVAGGYFYVTNLQSRLDAAETKLEAAEATIVFERAARDVARAEAERQAARAQETRIIRRVIRRDPDANDPAPALLLDTVRRLRGDGDALPAGGD